MKRTFVPALLGMLALCLSPVLWAMSVAFINPGHADEAYWLTASRSMQAAADDLGIRLQVFYAGRNYARAVSQARALAALPAGQRPDYVIASNEFGMAAEIVPLLDRAGIPVFLAYSGRGQGQLAEDMGAPRQRYRHWLGSLEPRAHDAGYLTGQALIRQARAAGAPRVKGKMLLLVIGGDRNTPTSVLRLQGLYQAVREAGDVMLAQEVLAFWDRRRAAQQARWLYRRHPEARMLWAGSDQMALGAMDSWRAQGGKPGQGMLFAGVNTSTEAMQRLEDGQLATLAGGHFITGAWALVMLYDYAQGHDFASEGLEQERPLFLRFDAALARQYLQRYGDGDFSRLDFARFSKARNPGLRRYDFGIRALLPGAALSPK